VSFFAKSATLVHHSQRIGLYNGGVLESSLPSNVLETSLLKTGVSQSTAPVAPEERSLTLDILRGFCLLGILFMNITTFVGFWFKPFGFELDDLGYQVDYWTELLATSSFRPSLALLFGLGFALQLRRNPNAIGRFSSRLLVLLAFGLIHGFGIWYGDILTEYAVVGFLLIPFAKRSNVTVLIWAVGIFLAFPFLAGVTATLSRPLDNTVIAYTFANGTWLEVLRTNALVFRNALAVAIEYMPQTISCFLLGLWLGRVGALERPQNHRGFLVGALAVTSLLAWWGYRQNMTDYNFFFDQFFSSPTLGFAYIAALALLVSFSFFQKVFYFFSYTGRMPLTTYLTASVVLGLLFYGYGLGWYGQFQSGQWVYVAVILYASQVVYSWLWLKFFRVGPLEWLWRSLTYGKLQPIRKTATAYSTFGVEKVPEILETPFGENPEFLESVETLDESVIPTDNHSFQEISEPLEDKTRDT
jgi:uncharacterized protein